MNNAPQKIKYDGRADALYIYVTKAKVFKTFQINETIFIDISKEGSLIGIEILDASDHFDKTALTQQMLIAKG